ncbi:MAG: hypothetical protein ACM3NI_04320, partial [Bacteroidota bacterium]
RIGLDPRELADKPLRVGLSMQVAIDTHDRAGNILARTPVSGARYQTTIYADRTAAADKLIAAIVRANDAGPGATAAR